MILAAGRGTRLGPLTESLPKPLLPVANKPVMAQGIQTLRRLGITEVCVNACYRAQQLVDAFGDGRAHGVKINWAIETEATGTAGGMKGMQHILANDEIVVIAGDAMLDLDLAPLLEAHRARRAFATLATISVAETSQYGVVVSTEDGRIIQFQEKPTPGTEISRQANTGIYIFQPEIFDLIPVGCFYDFALDVFPEILRRNLPFYAFPVEGYWTDIGNPGDYLQANLDYLAGHVRIKGHGQRVNGNLIAASAVVSGTELHDCVIGDGVVVSRGSALTRCIIWPGTRIADPLHLSSTVLTPWGAFAIDGKTAAPTECNALDA